MITWNSPHLLRKDHWSYSWVVVSNVLLTTFLAVFSAVATIIADDSIQGELALSNTQTVWLTTLYLLGINTTVPAANWFADKFGPKTMYAIGVSVFALSSGIAGIATNFLVLAFARLIEGIGAGFIFPVGLATIVNTLPKTKLSLGLILYVGASFGAGFALGLPLSGYLSQFCSWRDIFFLILPFGLLASFFCWLLHHEADPKESNEKFDTWGFISFALFIASLLVALTLGPLRSTSGGWRDPLILSCFFSAFICGASTLWIESKHPHPIIPLALFKDSIFTLSVVAMFLLGMSIFGSVSVSIQYMLEALSYEKFVSGKIAITYGISLAAFSIIANFLLRFFPPFVLIFAGFFSLVYGYFLNNELDWTTGPDQISRILFFRGMGVGLALGPTTIQAMRHVPVELASKGATLLTFFRQVGGTYGGTVIAIITIKRQIFHAARFGEQANAQLAGYRVTFDKVFSHFYTSVSDKGLESAAQAKEMLIKNILVQSFIQAQSDAMIVFGIITAFVAILLVLFIVFEHLKHNEKENAPPPRS